MRAVRPLARLAAGVALWLSAGGIAAADTTLTFRFNDPEAPQMRQALDVFEQQNPGIKVDMQRVPWADAQQQFLREAADGCELMSIGPVAGGNLFENAFYGKR